MGGNRSRLSVFIHSFYQCSPVNLSVPYFAMSCGWWAQFLGLHLPQSDSRGAEKSHFKPCFPRFQKYPDWDFLRKEVCGEDLLVEDGQCLNSQ